MPTEMELTLEQTQQGVSYEVSFDESNTHVLERFYTSAGNPVKEILLKLNLPDHRKLKDGGEDATLKLFKSTNQERYEHVGPEVTRSQNDKVTRWRNEIMLWFDELTVPRSHLHLQVKIKEQARA
ncbi:hypothetical protein Tco_0265987 [Tanacetum coccineum]